MRAFVTKAQYRMVAHALKSINRELFELCMAIPMPLLMELKHVEFIVYEFQYQFGKITMINKPMLVACLYRLYNPAHLYGKFNKLPIGLREEIARVLGYVNPENINAIATSAPAHYKNPRTAKKINDFADEVYHILSKCGELSEAEANSECKSAQLVLDIKKYIADPNYKTVNSKA